MSQKYSDQTLLSLKEGDVIYIENFIMDDELGRSKMVVDEVINDAITGICYFENLEDFGEYGEIYQEDWKHIYLVEKAS